MKKVILFLTICMTTTIAFSQTNPLMNPSYTEFPTKILFGQTITGIGIMIKAPTTNQISVLIKQKNTDATWYVREVIIDITPGQYKTLINDNTYPRTVRITIKNVWENEGFVPEQLQKTPEYAMYWVNHYTANIPDATPHQMTGYGLVQSGYGANNSPY